jgi:hypothetical protein
MKNIITVCLFFVLAISFNGCSKETVTPTGSIMLVNNSENPYDVYVNGQLEVDNMPGNSARQLSKPVGSYAVRVVQVSGYLLYATDITYNGTLEDKDTLVVSFPD